MLHRGGDLSDMKLIMENWRKYLLKEYSGFEIPSDKSSLDLLKKIFSKNLVKYPLLVSRFTNPAIAFASIMLDPSPTAVSTLPDDYSSLKRDTIDDYKRESAKQDKDERKDCEGNIVDLSGYDLDIRIKNKVVELLTNPDYCDVGIGIDKPNYFVERGEYISAYYVNLKTGDRRHSEHDIPGGTVGMRMPSVESTATNGRCLKSSIITSARATEGWGPLLYELLLEFASDRSTGLTPDRSVVSSYARKVWTKYQSRPDTRKIQLDVDTDLTGRANPGDNITPDVPEDDCKMDALYYDPGGPMSKLVNDPLSMVYRKDNRDLFKVLLKNKRLIIDPSLKKR